MTILEAMANTTITTTTTIADSGLGTIRAAFKTNSKDNSSRASIRLSWTSRSSHSTWVTANSKQCSSSQHTNNRRPLSIPFNLISQDMICPHSNSSLGNSVSRQRFLTPQPSLNLRLSNRVTSLSRINLSNNPTSSNLVSRFSNKPHSSQCQPKILLS